MNRPEALFEESALSRLALSFLDGKLGMKRLPVSRALNEARWASSGGIPCRLPAGGESSSTSMQM